MYKPKFCAECGEKIIRLRWRLCTSRKFCVDCAPRFVKEQAIQLVVTSIAVFLFGIIIGHATRRVPPPLVIQRTHESHLSTAGMPPAGATSPASSTEEIYTCGARTKKGTPCSRRVHGPVRCWQHKGMPAMLAQEKLHIKE